MTVTVCVCDRGRIWSTVGESGNTRPGLDRQETTPAWFQDMPRVLTKEHQVTKATPVETSLSVPITGLHPAGQIVWDGW